MHLAKPPRACSLIAREAACAFTALLLALAVATNGAVAVETELRLQNGGKIEGRLLNPDEKPRRVYEIATRHGVVYLNAQQVKEVIAPTDRERNYSELLSRMPATAEGNWKMAQWCQQNFMQDEREKHLQACIQLDPNNEDARRALGYTLHDGKWMLADVLNRQQGLIRHGMRWQFPGEIALERSAQGQEIAEKKLAVQLRTWRTWYLKGKKNAAEAKQNFLRLRDPAAIPAVARMLSEEELPDFKRLMVQVIRNIGAEAGSLALINEAMTTRDQALLSDCFDGLREIGRLRAAAAFTAKLRSKNPADINRAASGLSAMNAKDSIPELIDSLVTTHKVRIGGAAAGSINPTFTNNGGGGLSMGGGPKEVEKPVNNQSVREALVAMTGVNFGFDEIAWKNWLIQTARPVAPQLRRGQ